VNGRKRIPLPTSTIQFPPRHVAPEVESTPPCGHAECENSQVFWMNHPHGDPLSRHGEPLIWTVVGGVALFALTAVALLAARLLHR
jgi:hypothetical protein